MDRNGFEATRHDAIVREINIDGFREYHMTLTKAFDLLNRMSLHKSGTPSIRWNEALWSELNMGSRFFLTQTIMSGIDGAPAIVCCPNILCVSSD